MSALFFIFVFGCFITALVALGLVFGISALNDGSLGGFEGRAGSEADE